MYKLYSKIPGKLTRNIINYYWIRTKRWVRNVLMFGSEKSQARVRIVLGPKSTKGPKGLGSESSGYLRSSVRQSVDPCIHPSLPVYSFLYYTNINSFIHLFSKSDQNVFMLWNYDWKENPCYSCCSWYACRTEHSSLHREYAYTSFIYLHKPFQPMKFRARFPSNFSSIA